MVIGLTGGSGCGKTTALRVLREQGAQCLDADEIYHELLGSHGPMLEKIGTVFPGTVEGDALLRKELGRQVFGSPAALHTLSAITHPYVVEEIRRLLRGPLSVIDAFGLIESGLGKLCDHTVAITAPAEARIARIMDREGVSRDYAAARVAAQRPNEAFSRDCEFTLCNDKTQAEFEVLCRTFFQNLTREER
ncbi:MAG: dephospho-CoA kinase [Oscillospiraceae bacterium]|nr:dephospho-CoA kinase [Oscillospiraceae bacterium]